MLAALLVTGCSSGVGAASPAPSPRASAPASVSPPSSSPSLPPSLSQSARPSGGQAERTLAAMSLRDKVAQLFTIVVWGQKAGAASKENEARYGVATPAQVVEKFRPGGVILFDWAGNVSGASQVAALTTGLREAAARSGEARS